MTAAVVVGAGGFPSSFAAVGRRPVKAASRGTALRLVHASGWPMPNGRRTQRPPGVETTHHLTVGKPVVVLEIEPHKSLAYACGGYAFLLRSGRRSRPRTPVFLRIAPRVAGSDASGGAPGERA
ncbi:hypothetical protein ABZX63_18025, partial [Streptomyces tendae]